jgi:hypothetical protein
MFAATLAYIHDFSAGTDYVNDVLGNQVIVQHHVGTLKQRSCPQCEQVCRSGSSTDDVNLA